MKDPQTIGRLPVTGSELGKLIDSQLALTHGLPCPVSVLHTNATPRWATMDAEINVLCSANPELWGISAAWGKSENKNNVYLVYNYNNNKSTFIMRLSTL